MAMGAIEYPYFKTDRVLALRMYSRFSLKYIILKQETKTNVGNEYLKCKNAATTGR
jgi:hypothetical protein